MIAFVVEDGSGLTTSTSYVSVEEADDIAKLDIHNSDAWMGLPLDAKQNILIFVSRILDSRTLWNGARATTAQALEWPRTDVVDRYNNSVSSSAVPYAVRWAVLEMAKWTLATDRVTQSTPANVVNEVKVDSITLKFADATQIAIDQFKVPDIVSDILKGLGSVRNSSRKVTFGKVARV